ncbi:MAG TPA: UDP-N-acetylmuramoyl-L-alanine--D-glutamate ligase [Patescibacteria group bacterium]|nr:UDP-N-acetylmuramoyl-L-alanine--D-glutamate ligase [Patescibacteria group bacterium]
MKKENNEIIYTDKIALLGLGKDNLALLNLLDKHNAPIEVTICDFRSVDLLPKLNLKNIKPNYQLGTSFNQNLYQFDILYRSPGWSLSCPGIKEARKNKKIKITSALNIFFELCPSKNIIGVTGTKGKGTTATLIYEILKAAFKGKRKVFLGGNIGISPLSFLEKINTKDFIILELSSFQLEDLNYSPFISVITNLYKEHLAPADPNNPNYHLSFSSYWKSKLNIASKKNNKYLIANKSLQNKLEKENLDSHITYFSSSSLPTKLKGDYNKENIAASVAVSKILKIKPAIYKKIILNFNNLEHRLELVTNKKGVTYYNNTFSTTPESTILDLESFSTRIIQIAGGADKGADFKGLARAIKKSTSLLILLPGLGSDKIKNELKKINFPKNKLAVVKNMKDAVKIAKLNSRPSDTVLLSTGCASFGIFKNYKERGNLFKKYVNEK